MSFKISATIAKSNLMNRINTRPLCSNAEMGIKSILWYKLRWTEEKSAFAHFHAREAIETRSARSACLVLQFITYDVWSFCWFYHRLIGRLYVSSPVGQETEKKMGYSVIHSCKSWAEETCATRISKHWHRGARCGRKDGVWSHLS